MQGLYTATFILGLFWKATNQLKSVVGTRFFGCLSFLLSSTCVSRNLLRLFTKTHPLFWHWYIQKHYCWKTFRMCGQVCQLLQHLGLCRVIDRFWCCPAPAYSTFLTTLKSSCNQPKTQKLSVEITRPGSLKSKTLNLIKIQLNSAFFKTHR